CGWFALSKLLVKSSCEVSDVRDFVHTAGRGRTETGFESVQEALEAHSPRRRIGAAWPAADERSKLRNHGDYAARPIPSNRLGRVGPAGQIEERRSRDV